MKEILFKSKNLTIAADSDGAVIYGTAPKTSVIKYLSNFIPKTTEEAIGLAELGTLILISKYVIAKKIVTEVTVEVAKPSVVKTAEDALRIASKFDLEAEVQRESLIMVLHHWRLFVSGTSFDCFGPLEP